MGNGKLDILCQAHLKVRIRGIVQVDGERVFGKLFSEKENGY